LNFSLIAFLVLILGIFILSNYYIGRRIYKNINYVLPLHKGFFWLFFIIFSSSYIFSRFIEKYLPYKIAGILVTATSYWIIFFFYAFLFFLFLDFIAFLDKKIDFLPEFLKYKKDNRAVITVFLITIIMALGIFGTFQAKDLQVTEYTIETPKELKQNYTVVLISDIHISYQVGYEELKKIIDLANAQNPDYIFIAGDFFDGDWRTFYEEDINSLLKEFSPRKETYMVLGNHDNFMENSDIIPFLFGESGIKVLRDEKAVLNEDLLLVGRKDVTEGRERYGEDTRIHLEELFKDENSELFSILMDHAPLEIYDAEKLGVNLQVSGHTHQGQIYPFGVITERYFPFDYGHLIRGDYHLIASSGVGTWGPPVRIGTKSEIVRINVKQKVR